MGNKKVPIIFIFSLIVLVGVFGVVSSDQILNVPEDHTTIQAAIDAASSGDTINVGAGIYPEELVIDKSLTLIGDPGDSAAGPGVNAPLLDGQSTLNDAITIQAGVSDVTISGFEMANYVGSSSGVGNAIQAWNSGTSNIEISDNYMHNLDWNGVLVGNDGATGDHNKWVIKNNILENYRAYGLELTNARNSVIEGNIVTASNSWTGVVIVARRNEINITIQNNEISGAIDSGTDGRAAIYVLAWDVETANLNLDDVKIKNNEITTTGTKPHIRILDVGTGEVINMGVNNNILSSLTNDAAAEVNAEHNWWGSENPDFGSLVSGNVDFDPWLLKSTEELNLPDTTKPLVDSTWIIPTYPNPTSQVNVFAEFTDENEIHSAQIKWCFKQVNSTFCAYDSGTGETYVNMSKLSEFNFSSPIPIPGLQDQKGFGEGTVEYRLRATDFAGNFRIQGEGPHFFTYDGTSPVTTANVNDNDFITSNTEIVLTREDPDSDGAGNYEPSGVNFTKFSIDDGTLQEYSIPFPVTGTDRVYTITFFSVDNASNQESEKNITVNLDNTAPEVAINNPEDKGIFNTTQLLVNITATDANLDIVLFSINSGTNLTYTSPVTETFVEGSNMLEAWAVDKAGNVGSDLVTFTVDTIAPTITDNYTSLSGTWINSPQTVKLTPLDTDGSEIASVFTCEGAECVPDTILVTPFELSFIESQDTIIRYQAFDVAGNPSAVGEFNVKIDLITPITTDNVPADWQNTSFDVTLTVSDDGFSPIAQQTNHKIWKVGTVEPTGFTPGNIISVTEDGEFNIKYFSQDMAGNVEEVKTASNTAKLDTTAPSVNITSPTSTDKMDFFFVQADMSDETSGLNKVTLNLKNKESIIILTNTLDLSSENLKDGRYEFLMRMWELVAGNYTLEVTVTDKAGNSLTDIQPFEIKENVAPRKITAINNQVSTEDGGTVSFEFNVTVRGDGNIIFGMDDISELPPSAFNATISNGTVNATVGRGIEFTDAEVLVLEDLDLETPNVQGVFTLYLDIPADMVPRSYPINYFIDVA